MSKFFEVTVEVVVATLKNGKDKKAKEEVHAVKTREQLEPLKSPVE